MTETIDRPAIVVTVVRTTGRGLTQEVESLLKNNCLRWFTLRDVLAHVRRDADKAAVQSILHKCVVEKQQVCKRLVDRAPYPKNVRLLVASYKWRLPSDGRI